MAYRPQPGTTTVRIDVATRDRIKRHKSVIMLMNGANKEPDIDDVINVALDALKLDAAKIVVPSTRTAVQP